MATNMKSTAKDRDESSNSSNSFFSRLGITSVLKVPKSHSNSDSSSQKTLRAAPNSARVTCYEDEMRREELIHVARFSSLEFVVEDTLAIGFLKFFCELQFNVENIYFIVEVSKLRDMFAVDSAAWNSDKDWKSIDAEVGLACLAPVDVRQVPQLLQELQGKKVMWPSNMVNRSEVEHKVLWMWNTFFSSTAPHEICVSAQVLQNTIKRFFLLHIYGPKAFDEALIDPLKTLKRDIYPRFVVSELAAEMRSRLQSLNMLPPAQLLVVSPPKEAKLCNSISVSGAGQVDENAINELVSGLELSHVLQDSVLYDSFLFYLKSIMSSENLLCVRMIEYFKELTPDNTAGPSGRAVMSSGLNAYYRFESINQAWLIYLYFVHPGSAFEVSLSHRRRKEIRLAMANPNRSTFDRLEKSAMDAVRTHFINYRNSGHLKTKLRQTIAEYVVRRREEQLVEIKAASRLQSRCCSGCCSWWWR